MFRFVVDQSRFEKLTRHQIETATKRRENQARKGAFDREKRHFDFREGDRPRERGPSEGERRGGYAEGYEREISTTKRPLRKSWIRQVRRVRSICTTKRV